MTAWRARRNDEEGATTVLVVGLATAMLMVAGLVYDGGQIVNARREAFAVAANAARAGAQAVDLDTVRAGVPTRLDPDAARSAALGYLERSGHAGQVTVAGDRVQVRVRLEVAMTLLGAIGLDTRAVTGTGTARPVRGVSAAEGG